MHAVFASRWPDAVVCVGLALIAWLLRRQVLPSGGLFFDDSWVAAGAVHGQLERIMTTGSAHPGFTVLLMAIDRAGGSIPNLAWPALVAGTLGPPALYLAMRRLGWSRSIGLLLGAALAVADIHLVYSGRVKAYVIDVLLIIVLIVVLPSLARRRWSWPLAGAWVAGALALSSISGYLLVATAVGIGLLVIHANEDRLIRIAALVAQGMLQLGYYLWARQSTDLPEIEAVMETQHDGHLDFTLNPIELARESLTHLERIARVYPGGAEWWLVVLGPLAVLGLVLAAWRGQKFRERFVGRYLLALVAFAYLAAFFGAFPFGPTTVLVISAGGRHSLWLVPALAFGLGSLLWQLRTLLPPRGSLRLAFDAALTVTAGVILVAGYDTSWEYPFPDPPEAVALFDEELGPDDIGIVHSGAVYSYAIHTDGGLTVVPTPDRSVGFNFRADDQRVVSTEPFGQIPTNLEAFDDVIGDADRVVLLYTGVYGATGAATAAPVLEGLGFSMQSSTSSPTGPGLVETWTRDAARGPTPGR